MTTATNMSMSFAKWALKFRLTVVLRSLRAVSGLRAHRCRPAISERVRLWLSPVCAPAGTTVVEDIHYIERGYEDIIEKLRSIGAQIESVECEEVVETRQIG